MPNAPSERIVEKVMAAPATSNAPVHDVMVMQQVMLMMQQQNMQAQVVFQQQRQMIQQEEMRAQRQIAQSGMMNQSLMAQNLQLNRQIQKQQFIRAMNSLPPPELKPPVMPVIKKLAEAPKKPAEQEKPKEELPKQQISAVILNKIFAKMEMQKEPNVAEDDYYKDIDHKKEPTKIEKKLGDIFNAKVYCIAAKV